MTVLLLAGMAAGCGVGGHKAAPPQPKLPRAVVRTLAGLSDDVARRLDAGDSCGARRSAQQLQQRTIAAVNSGRVPAALQEPLTSATAALVFRIHCVPPPAPAEDHGKRKDHGKHKGEGD